MKVNGSVNTDSPQQQAAEPLLLRAGHLWLDTPRHSRIPDDRPAHSATAP